MFARTARLAVLACAALLIAAPGASAATLCVAPRTGCEVDVLTIFNAMNIAASLPDADRIELGAKAYTETPLDYAGAGPVEIVGQGATQTSLTRPATNSGAVFVDSGGPVTLRDLTVQIPAGSGSFPQPVGVRTSSPVTLSDVRVRADLLAGAPVGLQFAADATVDHVDVDLTAAGAGTGVAAAAASGTVSVSDSSVVAPTVALDAALGGLAIRRTTARAQGIGIRAQTASTVTVESSLVRVASNAGTGLGAYHGPTAGGATSLTARHVTVVGVAGSSSKALVASNTVGTTPASTVIVRDSILSTWDYTAYRYSSAGPASVVVDHSIAGPGGTTSSSGQGSLTLDPTVVDVDPLFTNPGSGDYTLGAASPAVNQDPDPLQAGESATDLVGAARIIGGARDYGAYERASAPAVLTGAATVLGTSAAQIDGSVDPGGLTTTWRVRFGPTAAYGAATAAVALPAGATPVAVSAPLSGLAPGTTYHYAVEATNALGTATGADRTLTTTATGPPSGGLPGGGGTTPSPGPLRLSALAVRPSSFRAQRRGASLGARGAAVSYRLNRAETVVFSVRRLTSGVRRGRTCVASPRHGARRARRCTREVTVRGGFTHAGRLGANRVVFTGRVGGRALARGRYVLLALPRGLRPATASRAAFAVR